MIKRDGLFLSVIVLLAVFIVGFVFGSDSASSGPSAPLLSPSSSSLIVGDLEGFGNGYACLDTHGNMYRSDFPCTFSSAFTEIDGCFSSGERLDRKIYPAVNNIINEQNGEVLILREGDKVYKGQHVIVRGEDNDGNLLEVEVITNSTTGFDNDDVRFEDVVTGATYHATITGEGVGLVNIDGEVYDLTYHGSILSPSETRYIVIDFQHTLGDAKMTFYCDDFL